MWHPAGMARQYEASGSRTMFCDKWDPARAHTIDGTAGSATKQIPDELHFFIDSRNHELKATWLHNIERSENYGKPGFTSIH
jgi:hypothetical protein